QKPVLNDISFQIESGKTIAFVGPSGAGKTTICSLIPRFYDVNNGSVTIDGIDIRDMTMQSLRKQIGIVQQDVFLFTGTLKENIMYGKLDATDEEIARRSNKRTWKILSRNCQMVMRHRLVNVVLNYLGVKNSELLLQECF